jgi:hypothetical protein
LLPLLSIQCMSRRDLSVKGGTSERCYRTRRGRTDEQRYAIISPYFDGRIKMNGPYPEITNISFLAKLFFKTFISLKHLSDYRTIGLSNSLEPNFKSIQTTSKFKQYLRANLFKVSNYYMLGSRKCNIMHTRLRHQCNSLGTDLFRANIVNDPRCPLEDVIHYLLECLLYTNAIIYEYYTIYRYLNGERARVAQWA